MKKIIIIAGILLIAGMVNSPSQAEGVNLLTGKVYDSLSNSPIEGAVIEVLDTGHKVSSRLDGSFQLIVPRPGRYSITISTNINGLETVEKKIYIGSNTNYNFNIPDSIASYPITTRVPKPVEKISLAYPPEAKRQGIEAKVKMKLLITDCGLVKKIKIDSMSFSKTLTQFKRSRMVRSFNKAVRDMLLGAQFTPFRVNGKRTPVIINYSLNFILEKKSKNQIKKIVLIKGE